MWRSSHLYAAVISCLFSTQITMAHVALDYPEGGETILN